MQWSPDRNGGFSRADWNALALPTIQDPLYGYETVNVEAATRDPYSLLHWMRRMLNVRRSHAAFGRGSLRFLYPKNRKVLAYLRDWQDETILCVANVSRTPQAVELDLSEFVGRVPIELNGGSLFPPIGQLTYLLTLPPYGFYWFILAKESEAPSWHTPAPEPMPDYATLVLRDKLAEAVSQSAAALLERDALPAYLAKRRWFSAKGSTIDSARIAYTARLPGGDRELLLSEIETKIGGETQRWQMPMSIVWEDESTGPLPGQLAL
jgi:maltose alpha-D-glucosyltransferase/alpha-amylase